MPSTPDRLTRVELGQAFKLPIQSINRHFFKAQEQDNFTCPPLEQDTFNFRLSARALDLVPLALKKSGHLVGMVALHLHRAVFDRAA